MRARCDRWFDARRFRSDYLLTFLVLLKHLFFRIVVSSPRWLSWLCWLLGTSVQEIGLLWTMKEACLPKHVRCAYHQHGPFCVCAPTIRLFSQRRGSVCALCVSLNQATHLFLLSYASRTGFAVDEATNDLPRGWYTR